MRKASPYGSSCPLYVHDGFDLDRFTDFVSAREDFVVLDYHSYFVFTPSDSAEPASGHTSDIQTSIQDRLEVSYKRLRQNMIVGEWSCALTPESLDAEQDHTQARKDFCMAQYDLYSENSSGHHFWCKSNKH
jgi:glucan 1,3-beta-glucosidase